MTFEPLQGPLRLLGSITSLMEERALNQTVSGDLFQRLEAFLAAGRLISVNRFL